MTAGVLVLVAFLAFAPPLRAQASEDGDRSVVLLTAAGLLGGAIAGAAVGESLLLPLGVHLANGRRGSYWSAGGIAAMAASGWNPPVVPVVPVAVPITQLGLSVAIERR